MWNSIWKCLCDHHFASAYMKYILMLMQKSFWKYGCQNKMHVWKSVWNKPMWRSFCNCKYENHIWNASMKIIAQMLMWKSFYRCLCEMHLGNVKMKIILQVLMLKIILQDPMWAISCKCQHEKCLTSVLMWILFCKRQCDMKSFLHLAIWRSFWKC